MAEITVWTPEMVAVLRAHAWGRSTPAAIAAMLGVGERAVVTKASKIGVRFNAAIERPVRERIADLAAQGCGRRGSPGRSAWTPTSSPRTCRRSSASVRPRLPHRPPDLVGVQAGRLSRHQRLHGAPPLLE